MYGVVIGENSQATQVGAIAIGTGAEAMGSGSIVISASSTYPMYPITAYNMDEVVIGAGGGFRVIVSTLLGCFPCLSGSCERFAAVAATVSCAFMFRSSS